MRFDPKRSQNFLEIGLRFRSQPDPSLQPPQEAKTASWGAPVYAQDFACGLSPHQAKTGLGGDPGSRYTHARKTAQKQILRFAQDFGSRLRRLLNASTSSKNQKKTKFQNLKDLADGYPEAYPEHTRSIPRGAPGIYPEIPRASLGLIPEIPRACLGFPGPVSGQKARLLSSSLGGEHPVNFAQGTCSRC